MTEANDPPTDLDAGLAHHEAGRLAEAEAIYRAILKEDPDHPDALNLLGLILQDSGDLAGSIAVLSRAVTADPEFAEAFANLARAQSAAGDPVSAKLNSNRAIELDPELPEAHLQSARALIALQDDAAAVTAATRAADLAPEAADAWLLLAHAQNRLRDFPAAAAAWRTADQLAPGRFETMLDLGSVLTELKASAEALTCFRRAVALKPEDARGFIALGGALRRAEDQAGAAEALGRALELAPERSEIWLQQGDIFALLGRFAAAAECYERVLALNPGSPEALSRLVPIGKLTTSETGPGLLRAALADPDRPMNERISAGFALGSLLDEAGDYQAAFASYAAANQFAHDAFALTGDGFDLAQFRRRMDQLRAAFVPANLNATEGWGDASEVPVFVVGMPRSGTSLVEQILASHPRVHGAGERKNVFEIAQMLEATGLAPPDWDRDTVRREATTQLARLRALGGAADRVIDKLPDNILQLGHIAVLFPNARVIICRRDPRDVGLSCYFQRFLDGMAWTYDLADIAAREAEVERLTEYWHDVLPLRMLDVHYETLVGDLEGESRRMIEFLGLDWDDACLAFHATERAVQTASFWQVRQPLYSSSVERWKHYRPWIQPLLDGLFGLIPLDGAEVSVPAILAGARAQMLAGQTEPAESAWRLVIEREPDNVEALHGLGQLARVRGDSSRAVALLRRAVAAQPGDSELLTELARALRLTGDIAASAEAAGDAVARNPADASAQFLLGSARLELNDAEGAREALALAVDLAPLSADARLYFAMACMRLMDLPAAAAALREAVRLNPNDPECLAKLGRVLSELKEHDEALRHLRWAVELAPGDGRVHLALVTALWQSHDIQAALTARDQALRVAPNLADLWLVSGNCLAALGRFAEAADDFHKSLALDPGLDAARFALIGIGLQADTRPDVVRLRGILEDPNKDERDRIGAGHALGQLLDQAGDYDEAWVAYATAGQLAHAAHHVKGRAYDPADHDRHVDAVMQRFPPEAFSIMAGLGDPSEVPVFVVGMPRSGTTLVEQIVSSHPEVFGAGELDDMRKICDRLDAGPDDLPAMIGREAAAHLKKLRDLGGDAQRVIDKMPDNYQRLGHIAMMFPNARVIICNRDPRDVGLSCYFQNFGENLLWSTDLTEIAARCRAFDRLMSHWRAVPPLNIMEVGYEDLVRDLEAGSRRLIDFLGLKWDPACLDFHKTERVVLTASQWQVRQPLYTSSVGRWRHYRRHLQPLLTGLGGLVPSEDDENRDGEAATRLQLGCTLLLRNEVDEAIDVLRGVTEVAPAMPDAWIAFAAALTQRRNFGAAAEAWEAALALRPDDPALLAELAVSLAELKRFDEAMIYYRRADAIAPGNARVRYGIAGCLMQIGDVVAAAGMCRDTLETTPDANIWLLLANCEAALGHFDAAADACRQALALDPEQAGALNDLVALGERADDAAAKVTARDLVNDQSRPVRARVAAGYALGGVCDRHGEYEEAFAAFALANQLLRADRNALGHVFDRDHFRQIVDRQIAAFDQATFETTATWGDPSRQPVFVVGMPRSGTSLVEQIAASHGQVFGAGEQMGILDILATLERERGDAHPITWDRASVRREAMGYLEHLRSLGGDAIRIIDKQPNNILCLGQIAILYPNARVVVCQRDPRDVALSCFFQLFQDGPNVWTDDLADCGFRIRETGRLMDHWRKVLPIPMLEVRYETLVANLESESRRLIDFLGLDWDPACLAFHETERTVMTASHWQVRQPLYASSVGRWRHYQRHLEPLLRELERSP